MLFHSEFPFWRETASIVIIINSLYLMERDIIQIKTALVLTSILPLRSLKMEEMTVSSSVCWTSSLDGQISRRYTSFPSEVTPAQQDASCYPHTFIITTCFKQALRPQTTHNAPLSLAVWPTHVCTRHTIAKRSPTVISPSPKIL